MPAQIRGEVIFHTERRAGWQTPTQIRGEVIIHAEARSSRSTACGEAESVWDCGETVSLGGCVGLW